MSAETFSLKELKIAVLNKNLGKIEELSKKEPLFSSIEEAKELLFYINSAKELLKKEKNKISEDMQKIRKIKNYTE